MADETVVLLVHEIEEGRLADLAGHPVDRPERGLAVDRRARLDAARLAAAVTLVQADGRDVDLPTGHFALAFVAVNSFMHLAGIPDQLAALAVARRALRRKGSLIIDLYNPDPNRLLSEDNRLALEHTFEIDGRQVQKLVAVDSDPASQQSYVTYLYDETDAEGRLSRQQVQFTMRWLYRYELEHLLARAGFALHQLYGSYDLEAYAASSPRLIAVASPA